MKARPESAPADGSAAATRSDAAVPVEAAAVPVEGAAVPVEGVAAAPGRSGRRRRRGGRGRRRSGGGPSGGPSVDPSSGPVAGEPPVVGEPKGRADRSGGSKRGAARERRGGGGRGGGEKQRSAAAAAALVAGGYLLPDLDVVDGVDAADYPSGFRDLGLDERTLAVLAAMGLMEPTPIQEQAIPELLAGRDLVGQAQTGTGKTLAFGLPIMERLDPGRPEVQAIILVPTRELAQQVHSVFAFLARARGMSAVVLMGGRRLDQDFAALALSPQIVVGTPGRIIDHLGRGTLNLRRVRIAVLDEADRMLDIGFEPDIRRILSRCPNDRQTALYSATIPTAIKSIIWRYMRDPVHIEIRPEERTIPAIRQRYYEVAERDKLDALMELMGDMEGRTLIFCNMKVIVDRLVRRLQERGIAAEATHGDLDQRKRDRVMQRFRSGELQILVATNVASRGLDIPDVTHVVNFDLPQNVDEYVHRIGRTGRAGQAGSAITFVAEWDLDVLASIQEAMGDALERGRLAVYDVA